MEASRPASANAPLQPPPGEADIPLSAAVRELFSGLRAGAADVADLVAAEARVALGILISIILSAVGAAMLAVFTAGGLLVIMATELIAHGASTTMAIGAVTLVCAAGCTLLALQLRALARRVLFDRSRSHLRSAR
jgi:hypothetical protein